MSKDKFDDQAISLVAQKHQLNAAQSQITSLDSMLEKISAEKLHNQEFLDNLLMEAGSLLEDSEIFFEIDEDDAFLIEKTLHVNASEIQVNYQEIKTIDYIEVNEGTQWDEYLDSVETYVQSNQVNVGVDPFEALMSVSQRIALEKRIKEDFSLKNAQCDKYDYMIAGTCGVIGGLIDVFFVGLPGQGELTKLTDSFTDNAVQRFAKFNGWNGAKEGKDPTASAIGFLEKNFKVNYDHRHGGDVDRLFNMSTKNHHIKNLAHSPDLVGLFFSILDQFNSTAHFVDDGRIISVDTKNFELKGTNFVSKFFSGFVNWLGHLFSDVAGSSGAAGRGSGIPIPFYSLLQFVNVGEFGQHKQTFAKISVQVFEQGYDFRHGMALAIPVLVSELLTRITWVIKQRFYHKQLWTECIPSANNPELRRMLLVAHGSLCLIDTTDAALRSNGNMIQFMLRSNLIAWTRFSMLALKELKAFYREGSMDVDAVDDYLEAEYRRLL
jgi:hypothetical protein